MRTDSTTLSADALSAARTLIGERFGQDSCPQMLGCITKRSKTPKRPTKLSALQETLERPIRPWLKGDNADSDPARLYQWSERTIASQMTDAEGQTVTIRLAASPFGPETYEFGTSGTGSLRLVYGRVRATVR